MPDNTVGGAGRVSRPAPPPAVKHRGKWSEARMGVLFAAPFAVGFMIFTFVPMLSSLYYSFTDFNILQAPQWKGLGNFSEVFRDARFYRSLLNTAYLLLGVPLGLAFALMIAQALNLRRAPLKGFARAIAYIPAIIPVVVVAYLFRWILNGRYGLMNSVLRVFGITPPNWLLDPVWTRPSAILIALWIVGGTTVIYLAALHGVNPELYEAAELDGCGVVGRFLHVTWPGILPVTIFQLIVGLLAGLQNFNIPYLLGSGGFNMQVGGPSETLLTYSVYIYQVAFGYFRMGYASALAWILFVIALILTLVVLRLSRRVDADE